LTALGRRRAFQRTPCTFPQLQDYSHEVSTHPFPSVQQRFACRVTCFRLHIAAAVLLLTGILFARPAEAGAIVVGRSGTAGNCTVPTIQAAINRANGFGGYNLWPKAALWP